MFTVGGNYARMFCQQGANYGLSPVVSAFLIVLNTQV